MGDTNDQAPGHPGIAPRWTSSAKSGVGTAMRASSRVWFTLSHGIVNEVYYPHPDLPCTRDLGLIVTADGFFSEEKRDAASVQEYLEDGIPAYRLTNTCKQGRYRIEKEVLTDPARDVLLQRIRFVPLAGDAGDYRVYALIAPHLGANGTDNSARLGDYKGCPMLVAEHGGLALALACSRPWAARSVGFVGMSDGWTDLRRNGRLTAHHARADHGNVAMIGEIDLSAADGTFLLCLGFGRTIQGAAHRAKSSLLDGFEPARAEYVGGWRAWQAGLSPPRPPAGAPGARDLCRLGAAVLRCHEDVGYAGGTIASLSIPWGFAKGDDDLGGYHLVWPRDLVEVAGGLLAVGARDDARRILDYLRATQEADGRWPQNMWLDGTPYWDGVQMDETALPVLLLDLARREGAVPDSDVAGFWPMARLAAGYLVRKGPSTEQGRWEEDSGYTLFTIAAEIAALLVAADLADAHDEPLMATFLRETADLWNASIEAWLYAEETDLARQVGVPGYYVRVARSGGPAGTAPWKGFVAIKNREGSMVLPDVSIVSPDALALVRFGLRASDDPRVAATVRVIDATLKVETPFGPAWHRYNEDGYGEHADGAPFDGVGIGRAWPLLAGERGHYELAAGRRDEAVRLLTAMEAFASDGGMIPEQVWDSPDIPDRSLFLGRPSGSAMPLAWAHAEHLKLARSIADGQLFDLPPQTVRRYLIDQTPSPRVVWRFDQKRPAFPRGKTLRIEVMAAARLRWHLGDGKAAQDAETTDTGLGVHFADLPTEDLPAGSAIHFTFHWREANRWENVEYRTTVEPAEAAPTLSQPAVRCGGPAEVQAPTTARKQSRRQKPR